MSAKGALAIIAMSLVLAMPSSALAEAEGPIVVSRNGKTKLIAEPTAGAPGIVYVFVREGSTWTELPPLLNPDGRTQGFGYSLALSPNGKTALITVRVQREGPPDPEPGDAWVYTRDGTTWTRQVLVGALAGEQVSLAGNRATVGNQVFVSKHGVWQPAS